MRKSRGIKRYQYGFDICISVNREIDRYHSEDITNEFKPKYIKHLYQSAFYDPQTEQPYDYYYDKEDDNDMYDSSSDSDEEDDSSSSSDSDSDSEDNKIKNMFEDEYLKRNSKYYRFEKIKHIGDNRYHITLSAPKDFKETVVSDRERDNELVTMAYTFAKLPKDSYLIDNSTIQSIICSKITKE